MSHEPAAQERSFSQPSLSGTLTLPPYAAARRFLRALAGRALRSLVVLAVVLTGCVAMASRASATTESVDAFVAQWTGQFPDYDNVYGSQCVDLFDYYNRDVVGAPAQGFGNAYTIYSAASSSYYDKHPAGDGYTPAKGDVAVWNQSSPGSGGAGHVGVVMSVVNSTTISILEANSSGTNDGPPDTKTNVNNSAVITGNHSTAYLTGYLHPHSLAGGGGSSTSAGVAFQANTGSLWTFGNAGTGDHRLGMAGGTSPAITWVGNGYQVAFQANTGNLWTTGPLGTQDFKLGMARGTSPSITRVSGGYEIAFQANTGSLWVAGTQGTGDLKLGMAAGTSPAIASCNGGYGIAFQASTGNLWAVAGAGGGDLRLGMAGGTSPAIACGSNGYGIAFQANTGNLWTAGAAGTGDTRLGMAGGTSPSIASGAGGFGIAFQANTGSLWTAGAAGTADRRLGMKAGTSPSIAGGASYNVAFQANTGNLWTYGAAGTGDSRLGMASGTSPAIA